MYLIASGRVEVESPVGKVVLEEGEFFGEMALLSREPRSASVTALRSTDLLVLDADDFLRLVDRLPDIGAKVRAVAKDRRPAVGTSATLDALVGNDGAKV
jgi:CRP-like cAMP-binding protein